MFRLQFVSVLCIWEAVIYEIDGRCVLRGNVEITGIRLYVLQQSLP